MPHANARRLLRSPAPRLSVDRLEDRLAPALFVGQTVQNYGLSALQNNGCVAVGDFNADGKQDAVLTNFGLAGPGEAIPAAGQKLSVLLGAGNGQFGSAAQLTVGADQHVSFVAVADVTGDGKLDLVCTSSTGSPALGTAGTEAGLLTVFKGGAFGTFTKVLQVATNSNNAAWVGVAELTGDGKLDVVTCGFGKSDDNGNNLSGNKASVFQGDGAGGFSLITAIAPGVTFLPTSGAIADFDGDGKQDLAFTFPGAPPDTSSSQVEGSVQVFLGNGAGGFTPGNIFGSGGPLPIGLQAADLNADGKAELVVANAGDPDRSNNFANFGSGSSVGVLLNAGGGNFAAATQLTAGLSSAGSKSAFAVQVADFTLDGKADIAAIVYGHPNDGTAARVAVYLGDGAGGFTPDADSPYDTGSTDGQYLAVGDLDGNGSPDLVTVGTVSKVATLLNQSTAPAATTTSLASSLNPAPFGTAVTFTATVASATTPGAGTVTFFDGTVVIGGPVAVSAQGVAAFTTSTLSVATHAVTARYNGAPGFAPSPLSAALSQVVSKASAQVALAVTPTTVALGGAVTITATVSSTAGAPTGTVTFFDGATQIGAPVALAPVPAGQQAQTVTTTLAVGTHAVRAVYNGAANFATGESASITVTVTDPGQPPVTPAVTLASSANPSTAAAPVTFTATLTSASGAPPGTVTFFDGPTPLGTVALAGGTAALTTTALSVGSHGITAQYGGAAGFNPATSGVLTQVVNPAVVNPVPTASTLAVDTVTPTTTLPVTFTVTVSSATGAVPAGSVQFFDGGAAVSGFIAVGPTGVAAFTTTTLAVGGHSVTARFVPANPAAFAASNSPAVPVTVVRAAVTIAVSGVGTATATLPVTLTATLTKPAGVGPNPSGTVTFRYNGAVIGTAEVTGGAATLTTTSLPVGAGTVTAEYAGDPTFTGVVSAPLTQQVVAIGTAVALATTATPSTVSQAVTFTATVSAATGAPAGTVTFFVGATPVSGPVPLAGGAAAFATTALPVGTASVTARFTPADPNFAASTSAALAQQVGRATPGVTAAVDLAAAAGQASTLRAAVSRPAGVSVEPAGTVTFRVNGAVVGTAAVVGGTASVSAVLPVGTNAVTTEFSGDDNFNAATATATATVPDPGTPEPPAGPNPLLVGYQEFGVGSGAGRGGDARFFNPNGTERFTAGGLFAGTGGVRVTSADFNGDGVADLVAGTGPGTITQVRVLDGKTRQELFSVQPFEDRFTGGVYVTAGDITGDGVADLVITPDEGGGPRVRVFSGSGFGQVADFFGIEDTQFRGGARASVGDINGDGVGDLLVAAGFGGGPRMAGFDGTSLVNGALTRKLFGDFFAFEEQLRNGAYVTAGDVDGDGLAELIAGGGPGGGPRVTAFSGAGLLAGQQRQVANFFDGDDSNRGGVRVAVKDLDGDDLADIVAGAGTGAGSRVTGYAGTGLPAGGTVKAFEFDAFPGFDGGVFVG